MEEDILTSLSRPIRVRLYTPKEATKQIGLQETRLQDEMACKDAEGGGPVIKIIKGVAKKRKKRR